MGAYLGTEVKGQTFSIVGSGTTANTTTSYPAPFGNYYWGGRDQFYITAAQLTAAGIPANASISSVGFNVIADNGTTIHTGFTLKVYQTATANPISAAYITTGLAAQSTASNYNPIVGWNQIALSTSFVWNGTSNLVIETCFNNTGFTTNATTQWTITGLGTGTWSRYNYADAASQCSAAGTTTSLTTRPNMRFGWVSSSACSGTPSAGAATITSATGCASVNFTLNSSGLSTGTGISYLWESSPNNLTWTSTGITTASYTTSTATTMYYRLKTTCSGSGLSNYTNVVSYTVVSNICQCGVYAASNATSTADDEILNVTLGTLNNTSTLGQLAGGAGSIAYEYSNYTGIVAAPTLQQASTYPLSVKVGMNGTYGYSGIVTAYIDYNQNGSFADAGELVYTSPYTSFAITGTIVSTTITIPVTATVGITRMRVIETESSIGQAPTGTYLWGETEDYCVTIVAAPSCSGTPNAGTAIIPLATGCASSNFTLTTSGLSSGLGISYQWETSPNGLAPWTSTGITTTTYTTSTATTMYYRLKTTCTNSGLSNYTNVVSYTVVPCCSNTLECWDSFGDGWNGGSVNLYVGGALIGNYTLATGLGPNTISFSAYTGQAIQITLAAGGTYPTEMYYHVKDASGTALVSNWYPNTSGTWNGTANCPASCTTPGTPTSLSTIVTGTTTATASWAAGSPAGSATVNYWVSLFTSGGTQIIAPTNIGTGLAAALSGLVCNTTYYFIVYANTTCNGTSSTTAQSGNFTTSACEMIVPSTGNNSYSVCSGHIYDHAGSASVYSASVDGYTVIYPGTPGNNVQVSGSLNSEASYDYLYIYNGVGTGGSVLWSGSGVLTVPTLTSTDPSGAITVRFYSDGSVQYDGFDLTISCAAPPAYKATFTAMNTGSTSWCAGETRNVTVTVTNSGTSTWTNAGPDINIGAKWSTNGTNWTDYFVRVDAGNLAPGASQTYTFPLTASEAIAGPTYGATFTAGTRTIIFDVVNEGSYWFATQGNGSIVSTSTTQTINASPVVNAGIDVAICNGVSTQLNGSAIAISTSNALGSPVYNNISSGSWTLGYAFTPSTNITVSAFRRYFGSKISIWDNAGGLIYSQAVAGTDGVWTDNALPTPITLMAGTTYRIAAFSNGGSYFWHTALGSSFANGTINTSYEGGGDAFPTATDAVLWWFVDFVYQIGASANYTWTPSTGLSSTSIANPIANPNGTTNYTLTSTANGCSASDIVTVTINNPSATTPTNLTANDFVWNGPLSNDWTNTSNWLKYNGSSFSIPTGVPAITDNVFIRSLGSCAVNNCVTPVSSTTSSKDLTIETGQSLTLGNGSTMNATGNWTNNGTFASNTSTVNFNGTTQQSIKAGSGNFYNASFNNTTTGNSDINLTDLMTIDNIGTFNNGIMNYSGSGALTFGQGATCPSGGSATSFVNTSGSSFVSKIGTNGFIFPVGEISGAGLPIWAPIEIAAPISSSTITADYNFTASPNNLDPAFMCDATVVSHTSGVEYWMINTNSATPDVTLYWKDGARSGISSLSDLKVAHFENCFGTNKWVSKGGTITGTLATGSIKSTIPFTNYSPVTFGSLTTPLPISLTKFNATCSENAVELKWTTASESNNSHFNIERSADMISWESIETISGAGNSNNQINYSYFDKNPVSGKSYYRLKQNDFDGKFTFSSIAKADCQTEVSLSEIIAYPNPAEFNIYFHITLPKKENVVLNVYDVIGQKVFSSEINVDGMINYQLNLDGFATGNYKYTVISNNKIFNGQFVKVSTSK